MRIVRYKDGRLNRGLLYIDGKIFEVIEPLGEPSKQKGSAKPIIKGIYPFNIKGDRIELKNVPGRTAIQIHVGNYPYESRGCFLPGLKKSPAGVLYSKLAQKVILNIVKNKYKKDNYYVEIV